MSRVEGVEELQATFRALRTGVRRIQREEVIRSLLNIMTAAKGRVAVDRGGLRNSITYRLDEDGLGGVVGTNSEYARATEFGRLPGSMPPVEPLIAWARRKGFDDPEAAGWAIAKHMEAFGTDPRPFLFPSFEEERPKFVGRIQKRTKDLIRETVRSGGSRRTA